MARKTPAFEIIGEDALTSGAVVETLKNVVLNPSTNTEWTVSMIQRYSDSLPEGIELQVGQGIYLVDESRLDYLKDRLGKLARISEKLGCEAPTATAWGWAEYSYTKRDLWGKAHAVTVRKVIISVSGTAPKLSDEWAFVATIEHMFAEGEWINMLYTSPDWEGGDLPKKFRTDGPTCDHCSRSVRRNNTYVLHNDELGFMRVGSTCIKNFLGWIEPAWVATLAAMVRDIQVALDEDMDGGWGGRTEPTTGVIELVARTAAVAAEEGWCSRGRARDEGCGATADAVWIEEMIQNGYMQKPKHYTPTEVTDEHRQFAEDAVQWARDIDPETDSDYLHNLRVGCMRGSVTGKTCGIVASAYIAYKNQRERMARREKLDDVRAGSKRFGNPGDKIGRKLTAKDKRAGKVAFPVLSVELTSRFEFQGNFGPTTIMEFLVLDGELEGNVIKWFYSGHDSSDVGDRFSLVATVKGHDTYRGNEQTLINRGVLSPLVAPEA
jgi:hypothetical protein